MTKRELISVVFVLAGIYLWLEYGLYVGSTLAPLFVSTHVLGRDLLVIGISVVICTVIVYEVGSVLIFRASALARRLFPEETSNEPAFPFKTQDLLTVAVAAIGLWLAATALAPLVSTAVRLAIMPSTSQQGPFFGGNIQFMIRPVFNLLVGLILFRKSDAVVGLWRRWQRMDSTNTADNM